MNVVCVESRTLTLDEMLLENVFISKRHPAIRSLMSHFRCLVLGVRGVCVKSPTLDGIQPEKCAYMWEASLTLYVAFLGLSYTQPKF